MQKTFEEIIIGEKASFVRTIVEQDVKKFVDLTGDDNPLHIDSSYALQTSYKKPVVHGMLSASFISTLIGKHLPGPGALWLSQNLEFCLPVRVGDALNIFAEVIAKHVSQRILTLKMEVKNQYDQIILIGEGKVKMLPLENKEVRNSTIMQKITLITGASQGIGAKTAKYLAKSGHWIVINYLKSFYDAKAIQEEIQKEGGKAMLFQADVSDDSAVKEMINQVKQNFGTITGLVSNASSKIIAKDFEKLSWNDIQEHINIQLKGTFNCVKAVLPHYLENKFGSTVIVGSIVTDNVPPAKWVGYSLAKSALYSLTKSLALEYGPSGIRFNIISPGMTDTGFIADIPEKAKMLSVMQTPLRRLAKPQDIAQAIAFLLNDESSFISGENLRVCGGQVML